MKETAKLSGGLSLKKRCLVINTRENG